jgi:Tfp pilus assembly protein FimT
MLHGFRQNERGFVLMELVFVIMIMMIVSAIAVSTWFGAVEGRRVSSGTNQLVADLRQAHTKATNRLVDQTVRLTAGSSVYTLPGGDTADLDDSPGADVVSVAANSTIVFKGDGSAQITGAGSFGTPITVRATNHPADFRHIEINPVTSEIKVVP